MPRESVSWLSSWIGSRSPATGLERARAPIPFARKVRAKINNKLAFAFRSEICNENSCFLCPPPAPSRPRSCPSLCPLAVADKLPGFELPFRLFMIFALLPLPLPPPYSVLCYVPSLWVFFYYTLYTQGNS